MAKQFTDIKLMGIDRRPSERQQVPGLCKELIGMQPSGPVEDPYWQAEPNVDVLRNKSGTPFSATNQSNIIRAAWHVRSSVGQFSQTASQALRRLAIFYNNGTLKLLDPEMGTGWEEVFSQQFDYGAGDYDASFVRFNNSLVFSVTFDGQARDMGLIVDDEIVPFEFPELPLIHFKRAIEGVYSEAEIDAGTYDGIIGGTSLYVSYAYKLFDGSLINQSSPTLIGFGPRQIEDPDEYTTRKLIFYNEGWQQKEEPDNLDFWKEEIAGIVILVGGHKNETFPVNSESFELDSKDLENIQFYEVAEFGSIDPDGKSVDERSVEVDFPGNEQSLSSYPLANVSSLSSLKSSLLYNYNSQLILGGTVSDFPKPDAPDYRKYFNSVFYTSKDGNNVRVNTHSPVPVGTPYLSGSDVVYFDVQSSGSISSVDVTNELGAVAITGQESGNFTITITGPVFTLTLNQDDFTVGQETIMPPDRFSFVAGVEKKTVRLGIEIETDGGTFQRLSDQFEYIITKSVYDKWNDGEFNFYLQGRIWEAYSYPDRRAKRLYMWEGDSLIASANLTSSQTQNFSYTMRLPDASQGPDRFANSVNNKMSVQPNRVQVSEVNSPFSFLASKSYRIGNTDNSIRAFAVNTLAVSQGQFGQYPLYVFLDNMIYALEQSGDPSIAFARVSPVSLSHGVASDKAIANVGRSIIFVYKDGIFTLSGGDVDEIGQPIGNYPGSAQIDFSTVTLAGRQRDGANELIVSNGNRFYVFSTRYGLWWEVDRSRKWFFTLSGQLYSIKSDGTIYDELSQLDNDVPITIEMDPVHFLQPELLKRLYAIYLRGSTKNHTLKVWFDGSSTEKSTTSPAMRIKHRSVFSFRIRLEANLRPGLDYLQALSAQIEGRYPQRTKITQPVDQS